MSGGGGAAVRGSQYTGNTSTRRARRGTSSRTVISASPGTTPGFRTITRIGYGPAAPSKKVSGLPTCADATRAVVNRSAAAADRAGNVSAAPRGGPEGEDARGRVGRLSGDRKSG